MGFRYKSGAAGSITELMFEIQAKKSTTYVADSLFKFSAGLPTAVSAQTDVAAGLVVNVNSTPYSGQKTSGSGYPAAPLRPANSLASTTAGEKLKYLPVAPGMLFEADFTPLINGAVATAGTVTQVVVPYGGSTSDLNGGAVYIRDLDWQGVIETSVVSAGSVTIVFTPPAPIAAAAGMIVDATAFGVGFKPKLDSTNPSTALSNAVADANNGSTVLIREIYLERKCADVIFANLI